MILSMTGEDEHRNSTPLGKYGRAPRRMNGAAPLEARPDAAAPAAAKLS